MDDSEYYAMMRRQYSHTAGIKIKKPVSQKSAESAGQNTPGTFNELSKKYGHEDAEMFYERNNEIKENENE